MDKVPWYLALYFLRIRSHASEPGYFEKRFSGLCVEDASNERFMAEELERLGLIKLSKNLSKLSLHEKDGSGQWVFSFSGEFLLKPKGRYFVRCLAFEIAGSLWWTAVTAVVAAAVALLVR